MLGGKWASAHFEIMRGTLKQAEAYIQKSDTTDPNDPAIVSGGDRPSSQGDRTEMGAIVEGLKNGASESDLLGADAEQYVKHAFGIKRAIQVRDSTYHRLWKTQVFWFYGSTGTGKSKLAHEITSYLAYSKDPSNNWWCGYDNRNMPDIIIDDYRRDMCTFSSCLRLFDRYPLQLQIKGGHTNMCANRIFLTTPKCPYGTWENRSAEDINQLVRRITDIVVFKDGHPPYSTKYSRNFDISQHPFNKDETTNVDLTENMSVDNDEDHSPVIMDDDSPHTKRHKGVSSMAPNFNL